jgi:predicted transcriptional regulator
MVITEEEETFFCVTPRGIDFLDTYWKIKGFLASFDEKNI